MLMRAATVVQVLRDLFYVLLQLLVVAAIIFFKSFITPPGTVVREVFYFARDVSFFNA